MEIADTKEYSELDLLAFAGILASKLNPDANLEDLIAVIDEYSEFVKNRARGNKLFKVINDIEEEEQKKDKLQKLELEVNMLRHKYVNAGDRYLAEQKIKELEYQAKKMMMKFEHDFDSDAFKLRPIFVDKV